jgi:hypothetical protein
MAGNTNTLIRTLLGACAVALLCATQAEAQASMTSAGTDGQVCADTTNPAGTYARCALMLDRKVVRRGIDAVTLGRPGFFRPIRLEQLVAGDSAKGYARMYERRTRQGNALTFVGSALMITGLMMADTHRTADCVPYTYCSDTRNETAVISLVLLGGGINLLSLPFHFKAEGAAARAVWWNNARFAH